jgi:hypothetical protein
MRVLQAAAVLVLVLAGVGLALSAFGGGGGGDASTAGDAGASSGGGNADRAAALGQFPLTVSGRAWTGTSLTEAVPDLLAARLAPPVDAQSLRESAAGSDTSRTDAPDDEGTDDGADDGDEETGTPAPAAAPAGARRLASGPALAECVAALADGPVTPLAVDLATWEGDPAAVILLPTPDDPATLDLWVVAPDCSAADAKVRYFARLARP